MSQYEYVYNIPNIIENDRGDIGEFLQWVMAKCTTSKTVNCGIRKTGGREIEFFMNTRYNKDAALKRFRKKSVPMCKYINGRTRS